MSGSHSAFKGKLQAIVCITYAALYDKVARLARSLRNLGIKPGDRIVGFMPNMIETVIAMLAATSVGAIWSSCSPDFGAGGLLDRFGQISPKGPLYGKRVQLRREKIRFADHRF